MSETQRARERLSKWCVGYGLDIGFGGDKIKPSAIGIDLPIPQVRVGEDPVQLGGDAVNLHWFKDSVLDYVYSSHLLEDFLDTERVLREWARVLRPGGRLVLLLPDETVYREYCRKTGCRPNLNHKHIVFNKDYVKERGKKIGLSVVHESDTLDNYSFEIVFEKGRNYGC